MANYNVGNIEVGVISSSKNAINNIDKVISKLQEFNKIDKNLQSVFNSINQLGNGINKVAKISLSNLNFQELYNQFNSLTRIIDPFISKIKNAEPALKSFVNALDLGKVNANLLIAEARVKAINSNTQSKEIINNLNIEKANANLQKTQLNVEKSKVQLEKANLQLDKMKNKSSQVSTNFAKLFDIGKIYFLYNYSKRIISGIAKMVTYASDYIEILNKFQVSFGDLYEKNLKLTNQLSEAFGFSTNTLMDYTATFNNMLKGLKGLTDETSALISQTLTKMAIDYSSLFNVSLQRSMEAFQSAISGNIRTLRAISGFDVSEITIFSIYQQLGGTKSMRQLNQLEKRLLRIIAIQQQMEQTGALGDYGRTINCGFDKKLSNENRAKSVKILLKGKYRDNFIDCEKAIKYCRA